ncbi:hypothetical protein [Streptomyces zagrosensis]|uniref:DNA-directed RNA polymerase subunit RPC12/RpoP n=1 Tax=Streptomyces zagrosensis TaxID=1042984 RepID=A0A7W9QGA4_9ACTN|nr:hypothetical protein [Streptomyces zagrosensis]MBB5939725.1 DNA-directed RNA polymerase subunit RPC12/RpoP [Streptomyces zagrosensis]
MTCPHCQAQLLRKERTGSVCSRCRKRFALDPREHGRGMHDLRIRRRVQQVTQDGRVRVTLGQLWYLTLTDSLYWGPSDAKGTPPRTRWLITGSLAAALTVAAVVAAVSTPVSGKPVAYATGVACLLLLGWAAGGKYRPASRGKVSLSSSYVRFRELMCGPWKQVYGELPTGIVDERAFTDSALPVAKPNAALLCPDQAVRVFLAANGLPQRLRLAVVEGLGELPRKVPVVVLHDASAEGALLASDIREALPGRVIVDAGFSVGVAHATHTVRLLNLPSRISSERLRTAAGLPAALADWLADGWWSPLAAVPPARLESVVIRAVEQAVERGRIAADPQHRRAAAIGFLTWPQATSSAFEEGRTT